MVILDFLPVYIFLPFKNTFLFCFYLAHNWDKQNTGKTKIMQVQVLYQFLPKYQCTYAQTLTHKSGKKQGNYPTLPHNRKHYPMHDSLADKPGSKLHSVHCHKPKLAKALHWSALRLLSASYSQGAQTGFCPAPKWCTPSGYEYDTKLDNYNPVR